ncbi:ATPase P-type K/Mg/Cd/Cu/Zn/Na/Ca/Na/H-transporter [Macrophomina phaseolina MS6]|uniref:ATPase P-type K/Mg/Cd/Cu/Zn/Na/Ca/Na/H-transporter n=1 Tax=Macrophomina phaseolina (strain MS6) TaxID=1126212 RepID=K2RXM2_MACPH|nr:ATPase P-type K/Mg/Cd/Cu/Zn/Na/Ca/Na/H-transporter [Macrophomina phaseolina MS6]
MTCSACSAKIEDAIGQLNGVARVTVALPFNQATVAYDESKMTPTDLINAIEELGYEAQPGRRSIQESLKIMQHEDDLQRLQKSFSGVLTYSLFLASTNMLASYSYLATTTTHEYRFKWTIPLIELALFLRIQHRHASHIHHAASRALRTGQTTMDTLTSATQAISLLSSLSNLLLLGPSAPTHFTTAALLLLVVLFGRYVDLHLRRNAMSTLTSLFRLQSDLAHVRVRQKRRRDKDAEEVLPAALLRPGDEMVIEPFDSVPCDAYVLDGESLLDLSVITGEPLPVAKSAGDFILSGSRNSHGRLLAAVVKGQEESTLAAMLDGVVEAAGRKADVEGTFGGLVRIFVAVIMGLATASAMVEHARAKSGMSEAHAMNKAAQRAMAVLAAACPCALGLAIPSAMLAFLDAASSQGVLLTGGAQSIEALTDITHVVLDKTGTLTQGRLQVTACKLFHPLPVERRVFLQLLCAAEVTEAEAHPIAKAVFAWAVKELRAVGYRPISDEHVFERRAVPGSGVECVVGTGGNTSHQVVVGNANFLVSHGVEVCMKEEGRWAEDYGITIHIAVDAQYVAQLRLSVSLKASPQPHHSAKTVLKDTHDWKQTRWSKS